MQIDMKQPILQKNDSIAAELRKRFADNHVYVVDLLASPGSGKTSTILATIDALRDEFNIAVIGGGADQHRWCVSSGKCHGQARGGRARPRPA